MTSKLFPILSILLFFSLSIFAQDIPTRLNPGSVVFEGEVSRKEGIWATNRSTIYTVNWFTLDAVYNGNPTEVNEIPVVTLGGGNEFEFVLVHDADHFYKDHKYILTVEPCTDCIEGMTVYIPVNFVGDFSPEKIVQHRNTLLTQSRTGLIDDKKECKEEEHATLYVSLGNIELEFEGALINGKMNINTRTNTSSKPLVKLVSQIQYDTDVFSENAITNLNISPSFSADLTSSSIEQSYNLESQDILTNEASIGVLRNPMNPGGDFIIVNTLFQSTMTLNFTLPITALSNLPNQLENLLRVIQVDASFLCNGVEKPFDEVILEDRTIGVSYAGSAGDGGITYSFETEYDYNAARYSVRVFASSPEPTLLYEGALVFSYNTEAFFPNQHSNGYINGIAGMMLANFNFIGSSDVNESTLRIDFSADQLDPSELLEINSIPSFLFGFSLLMDDCEESPNFMFEATEMQDLSFCWDGMPVVYDDVNATDSDIVILCNDCATLGTPVINEWFPAEIVAGDDQILTIRGTNFGDAFQRISPGQGGEGSSVLFYNGDYVPNPNGDEEPMYIAAGREDFNIDDIISWSNTEIQVKVPSTDHEAGSKGTASTGLFIVRNGCGQDTSSNDNLEVTYSLINYRNEDDGKAYKVGLRNDDSLIGTAEDGYEFEFDPTTTPTTGNNNIKDIFGDALSQWCTATNVRFKQRTEVNDEPATQIVAGDGKSLVIAAPFLNPEGAAAVLFGSQYYQISCGVLEDDSDAGYLMTEIDLVINPIQAQVFSADELEAAILHELGHAHMLQHSRCPRLLAEPQCTEPLMYPSGLVSADIITMTEITAANRVFSTSTAIVNAGNCRISPIDLISVSPIAQGDCATMTSTNEIDLSAVKVYPNPTAGNISIEGIEEFTSYFIHDFQGRKVLEGINSSSRVDLDLSLLPPGIYLLALQGDEGIGYLKLTKL